MPSLRRAALRPGACFSARRPHHRRHSARLLTQQPGVRPLAKQKASGTYCHWPDELSGSGQSAPRAQGPSRGMAPKSRWEVSEKTGGGGEAG